MLALGLLKRFMSCGPKLEYKLITPDRFEQVIAHLKKSFFRDEPLVASIGLCPEGEGNSELEIIVNKTLEENLSQMAVDEKGEIAGVLLNGVLENGYIDKAEKCLAESPDENYKKVFGLVNMVNKKANVFEKCGVDKVFDARILSVDPAFRGKGISYVLLKISEEQAKKCDFKFMKADATGIYSQKVFKANGFKVIEEMCYSKYTDDCGRPILNVPQPHTKIEVLTKSIEQKSSEGCKKENNEENKNDKK